MVHLGLFAMVSNVKNMYNVHRMMLESVTKESPEGPMVIYPPK